MTAWGGVREVFQREVMLELRVQDKGQQGKEGGGREGLPGRGECRQRLRHEESKAQEEMVRGRAPWGPRRGRPGMARPPQTPQKATGRT